MASLTGDMLRGHVVTMVLATLEKGEAHGYEIMQRLNDEGQGAFHMKEGTLYPVLYRLEERGYLATRWEQEGTARQGPKKRFYRLTTKGRRELGKQRESWREFVAVIGGIVGATQ